MSSSKILELSQLVVAYGGIEAVKKIDLYVEQRELVSLIGSNGAGKTSTLKAIAGLLSPRSGQIVFEGMQSSGNPHELVEKGSRGTRYFYPNDCCRKLIDGSLSST